MKVDEFRKNIKAGSKVIADGCEFFVEQVVKFRFDDGSFYIKCFLSDGFVLADDSNDDFFVLVKEIENNITEPFAESLEYDDKKFSFLFEAHAVAEEIEGKEIFKKGEGERFWDYESNDGSYLSLGVHDQTGERQDFYGKTIEEVEVV